MLSANLVLWIFSSLCSDKDCHTWQHEMMARWEQLEEPFHPNFSNWSFAFLDFYKVWKWHILLLCTNFDATDEIKCNLFESFKGDLFLDFVTGGCLTLWESFPCHKIYHPVVIDSPLKMTDHCNHGQNVLEGTWTVAEAEFSGGLVVNGEAWLLVMAESSDREIWRARIER